VKAAHQAEAAGVPGDRFEMETFVAIRNIETANGSSAAELESLLKHAIMPLTMDITPTRAITMMDRPSISVDTISPAISKTGKPGFKPGFSLFRAANQKNARRSPTRFGGGGSVLLP
jgi:hypothetical protein